MVLKPVLGCRPYIGDWAAGELCVWFIGQGPSFLVKKIRARTLWQTGKLGFNALSMSSKHIIPGKSSR